ncbi:hypothetical protein CCP3SC1_270046 [Gammaproteobacteria bacterium]
MNSLAPTLELVLIVGVSQKIIESQSQNRPTSRIWTPPVLQETEHRFLASKDRLQSYIRPKGGTNITLGLHGIRLPGAYRSNRPVWPVLLPACPDIGPTCCHDRDSLSRKPWDYSLL